MKLMTMDREATSSGEKSIELLQNAIDQLIESRDSKPVLASDEISSKSDSQILPTDCSNGNEIQIITKLISQLESLKEDGINKQPESSTEATKQPSSAVNGKEKESEAVAGTTAEDLANELRIVKRQNTITHWLLSGVIFLTVIWQLSEVSMILKVRDGLNHPFRSLWSFIKRMPKDPAANGQDPEKQESVTSSIKETLVESASLPLKLAELSQMDLELPRIQLPSLVSGENK